MKKYPKYDTLYTPTTIAGPTWKGPGKIVGTKTICRIMSKSYTFYTVSQKGTPTLSIVTFKRINGF